MPQPSSSDLQVVDPLLTNMSIAYAQQNDRYMADKVFPNVPVDVQGGKYAVYDRADWLRAEARVRAPGTESAGAGWNVSSGVFFCDVIAVHKDIDDITAAVASSRAGGVFNLRADATRFVTSQLLLKRDIQWVNAFFKAGVWGTNLTGVNAGPGAGQFLRWNVAGSTPITDIKNQSIGMTQQTGEIPNVLVVGPETFLQLSEHASIIQRIQYVERAIVTEEIIARLLNLDRVVVAWAIQNTANEGATPNYSFLAGKHALLAYAAPNAGLMNVSAGYTFGWTGYPGAGSMGIRVKNFRIEEIGSDRIEGEYAVDMKPVAPDLAVFYETAVA